MTKAILVCFIVDRARTKPSDHQFGYRLVVACLTGAGLLIDAVLYLLLNIVSWMGGPFALFATTSFTLTIGLVLWFLPARHSVVKVSAAGLAVALWVFASPIVFIWADGVQQKLWIADTERVAKAYGRGKLPPDCSIRGTFRGSIHTPLECKGTVAEVADWYRGRLGKDWVESTDHNGVIFSRKRLILPAQKITIFSDGFFVQGTSVVVSPTQTNDWWVSPIATATSAKTRKLVQLLEPPAVR